MALSNVLANFKEESNNGNDYRQQEADGLDLKKYLQSARLKLSREQKPRRQGIGFRPSTLTFGYCERLKVGQLAGLIEIYDKPPTPKLGLIFDMGNAIHDIFQQYFWEIGILKGSYKCIKCDRLYHDLTSPRACPSGIRSHDIRCLTFKEVQLRSDVLPISGRADGILVIEDEESLVDLKSIANRLPKTPMQYFCFEDLDEGPKEAHVVQLQLYMWLSGIPRAYLLYIAKNDHQIRSFYLEYDLEIIRPYLDRVQDLVDMAELLKMSKPVELPPCCGSEKCLCYTILGKLST